MQEKTKRFHILKENVDPTWRGKKGQVSMSEMDNDYLQSAKLYAQTQILHYHNKINIFVKLQDQLEEEAKTRNITLKDLDEVKKMGDYFEKTRILKAKNVQLKQQK